MVSPFRLPSAALGRLCLVRRSIALATIPLPGPKLVYPFLWPKILSFWGKRMGTEFFIAGGNVNLFG